MARQKTFQLRIQWHILVILHTVTTPLFHVAIARTLEAKNSSVHFYVHDTDGTNFDGAFRRHLLWWLLMVTRPYHKCKEFAMKSCTNDYCIASDCFTRLSVIVVVSMRTLLWILLGQEDGKRIVFWHRGLRQLLRLWCLLPWVNVSHRSVRRWCLSWTFFRLNKPFPKNTKKRS